ncbi:MAG: S8 family peptidase [Burkholderiales bacterium]|nr:S8 family peptidase [Burkholderiales bacterium]
MALALALSACMNPPPRKARWESGETTDRMIVKYRSHARADVVDATTMGSFESAATTAQARVRHVRRTGSGSHIMKLTRRLSLAHMHRLAAQLRQTDPNVEYAEPDRVMTIQFVPNDPSFTAQWHYSEPAGGLNLPAAWDLSIGSGVTVAVVDTGYRPHADLAANIVAGYDFITSAAMGNDGEGRDGSAIDPGDGVDVDECGSGMPALDSSWHGTHVAGTIAAVTNNGLGGAGVAPGAKVQPVRALGKCGGFTSDIADAIIWASGGNVPGIPANPTPARVVNLSLGASGSCDLTTQLAIDNARSRNSVVVVAAGNASSDAGNFSPASCNGVINVGAVGRGGARAFYSNYGHSVDVSAPGGDMRADPSTGGIYSTFNDGRREPGADVYAYDQGTSMAAPHVSGVVALMLARNPALTPDQVEAQIKASTRPLPVPCSLGCGTGIVDARAAVQSAIDAIPPAPPPSPPPPPSTSPPPAPAPTPPRAPPARTVKEVEPNGKRTIAQRVAAPARIDASIASKVDTDYYGIVIAPGQSIDVTLVNNSSSDYDLNAYSSAGKLIASSRMGTGEVDNVTLANTSGNKPMTVYLRVIYYSGNLGTKSGRYSLTVE